MSTMNCSCSDTQTHTRADIWRAERTGRFTASRISELLVSSRTKGEIFGQGAKSYIRDILAEAVTGTPAPEISTPAVRWGCEHESEAFAVYAEHYGAALCGLEYFGKDNPRFFPLKNHICGGSPDALVPGVLLVEIKCPYRTSTHIENMLLDLESFKSERKDYYAQIQLNMICTGTPAAHFVSYDPRPADPALRLDVLDVPRDYAFGNTLLARISEASALLAEMLKTIRDKRTRDF